MCEDVRMIPDVASSDDVESDCVVGQIFATNTIQQVEARLRSLRVQLDAKKTELRYLVGDRFLDFIATANSLRLAHGHVQNVQKMLTNVESVQSSVIGRLENDDTAKSDSSRSFDAGYVATISQIYMLTVLSRAIDHSLDMSKFALATKAYLLARHIHTNLAVYMPSSVSRDLSPVLISIWHSIELMDRHIVRAARHMLSTCVDRPTACVPVLASLVFLDNFCGLRESSACDRQPSLQTWQSIDNATDHIDHFLALRLDAIRHDKGQLLSVEAYISQILAVVVDTVRVVFTAYPTSETATTVRQLVTSSTETDWNRSVVDEVLLTWPTPCPRLLSQLPSGIATFATGPPLGSDGSIPEVDIRCRLTTWIVDHVVPSVRTKISSDLECVTSLHDLARICGRLIDHGCQLLSPPDQALHVDEAVKSVLPDAIHLLKMVEVVDLLSNRLGSVIKQRLDELFALLASAGLVLMDHDFFPDEVTLLDCLWLDSTVPTTVGHPSTMDMDSVGMRQIATDVDNILASEVGRSKQEAAIIDARLDGVPYELIAVVAKWQDGPVADLVSDLAAMFRQLDPFPEERFDIVRALVVEANDALSQIVDDWLTTDNVRKKWQTKLVVAHLCSRISTEGCPLQVLITGGCLAEFQVATESPFACFWASIQSKLDGHQIGLILDTIRMVTRTAVESHPACLADQLSCRVAPRLIVSGTVGRLASNADLLANFQDWLAEWYANDRPLVDSPNEALVDAYTMNSLCPTNTVHDLVNSEPEVGECDKKRAKQVAIDRLRDCRQSLSWLSADLLHVELDGKHSDAHCAETESKGRIASEDQAGPAECTVVNYSDAEEPKLAALTSRLDNAAVRRSKGSRKGGATTRRA